ncbi:MAG: hypothetical protein V4697_02580 [Patescibacteria group bacterium]
MDIERHKQFIKKHYAEYKKIGHVECPAFDGEKVYFNRHGFRHLVRKGHYLRDIEEQIERLQLLVHAPSVVGSSKKFRDFNKNKSEGNANFWSFIQTHQDIKIIVVVRQMKGGTKHFFSIMRG